MAVNPIDAPLGLDLKFRETPGGAIRQRRPSVPPVTAPGREATAEPQQQQQLVAADSQPETPPQAPANASQAAAIALNMNLKFSTDEETGKLVVSVVNPSSGEVLRQMPSEEALKVAEAIGRYQGLFVDLKV
jgi:flagellar protein FlaG